jgi:hemolysin activation/secretion protein
MRSSLSYAKRGLYTSAAVLLMSTSGAFAAALPQDAQNAIAGQASPGRIQDTLEQQDLNPDLSPAIDIENVVLQDMPANADKITFTLNSITLDGISVYTKEQIAPIYADKLGQTVSLADIYAISTALTNKYRNDGYILTQVIVPPQTIDGGAVQLRAVEGFVDQIHVEGADKETALRQIRAYANQTRNKGALNVRDLEKFLLLINDLPGVEARSILSPSGSKTGASDLRVIVKRDPYDAFLGVDNYGSRFLGPVQFTAAGALNSPFGYNERLSAQIVVAPDEGFGGQELAYFALGYDQPVGSMGTVFRSQFAHTNTNPGYTLEQFNVVGRSDFVALTLEHPFIRTRAENFYMHTTLDWRNVISKNDLEPNRHDKITSLRVGGRYEFLDHLFSTGINTIASEASLGLDALASSDIADPNKSRANGDPTYSKLTLDAQRLQRLTSDLNLLIAARGQWADGPLLSSEEFGIGGIGIGRGYDPSEIVGDDGVAGKLELQWNQPYPVDFLEDYQLFGFYDIGRVWNSKETISAQKSDSLASTGFGVRADFPQDTKAGIAFAFPMTKDVDTRGDQQPRVYLNLNKSF